MISQNNHSIIYTIVDEAPALATVSLLPIIKAFTHCADINIQTKDISLAGRILAVFSDYLESSQQIPNDLALLGDLVKQPHANIIKLPNISASIPQLKAAIQELQDKGYSIPNYPEHPKTEQDQLIKQRYASVLGSAVNPVLREGNSDRRAPYAVKNFAKKNPHRMGVWSSTSQTHVATMDCDDFRHNEQSITLSESTTASIQFVNQNQEITVLKSNLSLTQQDVIDATFMSIQKLRQFIEHQIQDAYSKGILFSLHMKATMMKVSDPIIFGEVVKIYYREVFEKYDHLFNQLGVNPNAGLQDVYAKIATLSQPEQDQIKADIQSVYQQRPPLAMVNSDLGVTNLHVPSDIIIDASMPAMIRESGKMWNPNGDLQDVKAVIPDSSYAGVYQAVIDDCKQFGSYDPATMGSVSNIGLMAQKAEEYGSHDKTFQAPDTGSIQVVDHNGNVLMSHNVSHGDIWRMCQVKDDPIQDWVKLAIKRAMASQTPAVFWLDSDRAHDRQLIQKVTHYIKDYEGSNFEYHIMSPVEATRFSVQRIRAGLDTISVTGNVLRDYNTDLFPILELGTSAKMLSIVPLMNGGGLFETGAGGSAPKHVQQFQQEGHLRWDSLGEFLALAASLDHYAQVHNHSKAKVLAQTLDRATEMFLDQRKSPSRKVGELDNRGSHFYLSLYWAQALADQDDDLVLKERFKSLANDLKNNERDIINDLNGCQGKSEDVGGYYRPSQQTAAKAMRPSCRFNDIMNAIV
ncbi:NADP-dependent isocitrate dehydrogenase [Candidatus Marinamargulisbacteria bacterium SCGC AG-410-N11]|nr:NADP-dependent isocitrate dehydrogenase [Candidatus Marinamargulisbacteria bacterium SCGC AG-410-N11]